MFGNHCGRGRDRKPLRGWTKGDRPRPEPTQGSQEQHTWARTRPVIALGVVAREGGVVALIDLAVRQALGSACRSRMGAVLVAGNRVLAAAPNLRRNNPMVDFRHATFHAEEAVLRRARSATAGAEVFVARVNWLGTPMLARPCPRCQQALAAAGVSRAHYTTGTGTIGTMTIPSPDGTAVRAPTR
jgi:hypothetical protein